MSKSSFRIIILAFVLPLFAVGQSPADRLFDKYSGKEGFTSVYITPHMFSLFADMSSETEEDNFSDIISGLTSIKILSAEEDTTGKLLVDVDFTKEIGNSLKGLNYEELMVVKEKDQNINFMIRKDDKKIKELLMLIGGKSDNTMISIQGDLDLKKIAKLSKQMKIEGMENLEKIEDK